MAVHGAGGGHRSPFQCGEPGRAAYRRLAKELRSRGIQHCVVPGCEKARSGQLRESDQVSGGEKKKKNGKKDLFSCSAAGTPHSARSQLDDTARSRRSPAANAGTPGATNAAQEGVSLPSAPPMEISSSPAMGRTTAGGVPFGCCVPLVAQEIDPMDMAPPRNGCRKRCAVFRNGLSVRRIRHLISPKPPGLTRPGPIRRRHPDA